MDVMQCYRCSRVAIRVGGLLAWRNRSLASDMALPFEELSAEQLGQRRGS